MTDHRASSLDRLGMRKLSMKGSRRGIPQQLDLVLSLSKDEAVTTRPPPHRHCFSSEIQCSPGSWPSLMKASTTLPSTRDTLLSKPRAGSAWPKAIELAENTAPPLGATK